MEALDWIIAVFLGIGFVMGFMKGFFRQLASLVGLIAGLLIARALFVTVGEQLAEAVGSSVTFAQILSFFLIWILVPFALSILASLLTRMFDAISLGFVNRLSGAFMGLVKYAFFISLAIHFIEFADSKDFLIHETAKQRSLLYYPTASFSDVFYPVVKEAVKDLIETTDINI